MGDASTFESAVLASLGVEPGRAPVDRWGAAYRTLSDTLTADRDAALFRVASGNRGSADEDAVAGLVFAARTFQIATELLAAYPPPPGPFVELGGGWGPFALAAASRGLGPVRLVDLSPARLDRAKALFSTWNLPAPGVEIADAARVPLRGAGAVAAPAVLNEILARTPPAERAAEGLRIVRGWLAGMAPGGWLAIVEPGLRETARVLQSIRDALRGEVQILGPCPHVELCPMTPRERDWCHFTWPAQLGPVGVQVASAAGRRHQEVHFSWLLLSNAPPQPPPPERTRLLDQRARERGKARATLCTAAGLVTLTALQRDAAATAALEALRPGAVVDLARAATVEKGDGLRVLSPDALRSTRPL